MIEVPDPVLNLTPLIGVFSSRTGTAEVASVAGRTRGVLHSLKQA